MKVRLRLARLLLERKAFDRARFELQAVESLKKERKEGIPSEVIQGLALPEIAAAPLPDAKSQRTYYQENAVRAEDPVFENQLARGVGVVDGIDTHTGAVFLRLPARSVGVFRQISSASGRSRPEIFWSCRWRKENRRPGNLAGAFP
ncbi:MAG: hypothetical protein IPH16_14005 [Haliscomenobacter sp.]|nr:hypothetical protein [Haliscomenobacter sp.]